MGATVSVSRRAAAFRHNGKTWYALLESTYSQNCYPHTPEESCIGFGDARQAIKWVLILAAETCGGMLRGTHGAFTVAGYIQSWIAALKKPCYLHDRTITLEVGAAFWCIGSEKVPEVLETLRRCGCEQAAKDLEGTGKAQLNLHQDASAIAALSAHTDSDNGPLVSAWRMIHEPSRAIHAEIDDLAIDLGPPRRKHDPELPAVFQTGSMRYNGHLYAAHRAAIEDKNVPEFWHMREAWELAQAYTNATVANLGAYSSLQAAVTSVSTFSKTIKAATQTLDDGTMLRVDLTRYAPGNKGGYYTKNAAEILTKFTPEERAGEYTVVASWGRIKLAGVAENDLVARHAKLAGPINVGNCGELFNAA